MEQMKLRYPSAKNIQERKSDTLKPKLKIKPFSKSAAFLSPVDQATPMQSKLQIRRDDPQKLEKHSSRRKITLKQRSGRF